jgi:hypothetical protein
MVLFRRPIRSNWRLKVYTLALVFVVLSAFLVKAVFETLAAQRSVSRTAPRTIPNTDLNPYGANVFLHREVEPWKRDRTLQMLAEAGIGWVKQQFPWEEIEPRRKGEFLEPTAKGSSWAKFDDIVAACEKYGLQIVARLDRPPEWTRQDNSYHERPPDNLDDYGDFVYAFVKHYQGRINYIQIWNEPNIFPEWGNRPVDPAQYVELLKIAYRRAKEANPDVYVLCAPLAMTLGQPHPEQGKWIAMSDLAFLEEMYKAGAGAFFDVYSANAFGMDRPPEDPPDAQTLNFQRVLLQHRIMERYGDGSKAVWFDEYGWNAAPESLPADRLIWKRVGEKEQADYAVRGIDLARRQWPWAGVFMIWYARQVGNVPVDRADYYFRMIDVDFTPRPLYLAIKGAATKHDVAGPGLYQETNPAAKALGHWRTVIDGSASGCAFLLSDVGGDTITFAFRGDGVDLITQRSSNAGRFLVSLDEHPVPRLPTNGQGQSYVDLYSPSLQTQARVALVRGADPVEHLLRVTVAHDAHQSATGRECAIDAFEVIPVARLGLDIMVIVIIIVDMGLVSWATWRTLRRVRWLARAP